MAQSLNRVLIAIKNGYPENDVASAMITRWVLNGHSWRLVDFERSRPYCVLQP